MTKRGGPNRKLGPSVLAALSRHGVPRLFREGAVLVNEGDRTDALYIILEGRVRAFIGDGCGGEIVLSVMGAGEYFGELALDAGPRSASVATLEASRILVVPRPAFEAFMRANPAFTHHFIVRLIGQVRRLTESVRSLAALDAYGRVAGVLMDSSVTESGLRYVPQRLTQAQIANRAGCSRDEASRILEDLAQSGHIAVERGRIVILPRER